MQSVLRRLAEALAGIENLRVYHYWRPQMQAPFCVWAEDGEENSMWGNNHKTEQVIKGTVDYYTKQEFDPAVDLIQTTLNTIEVLGWELNSVQYEDNTNLIHFEWRFQISGDVGL